MTWRQAMQAALYGPDGFYARGEPPARHFRTSVHVSPAVRRGRPRSAPAHRRRARPSRADRSRGCRRGPGRTARAGPRRGRGRAGAGPADRRARGGGRAQAGRSRSAHPVARHRRPRPSPGWSSPASGSTTFRWTWWSSPRPGRCWSRWTPAPVPNALGRPRTTADLAWLRAWWPLRALGDRAEVGRTRCEAWAGTVRRIGRGVALAADYGHVRAARPGCGTLTGYLEGRAVPAIPDGSRDITAHVALDACAAAGRRAGAAQTLLTTQREALRGLGVARAPSVAGAGRQRSGGLCPAVVSGIRGCRAGRRPGAGRFRLAGPDGRHGPARAAGRAGTLAHGLAGWLVAP